jgi:hypothetical protein
MCQSPALPELLVLLVLLVLQVLLLALLALGQAAAPGLTCLLHAWWLLGQQQRSGCPGWPAAARAATRAGTWQLLLLRPAGLLVQETWRQQRQRLQPAHALPAHSPQRPQCLTTRAALLAPRPLCPACCRWWTAACCCLGPSA